MSPGLELHGNVPRGHDSIEVGLQVRGGDGHRSGRLGADATYHSAYDERWRPAATYLEGDDDPKELYVHHNAGLGGFGGSTSIDAAVLRDKDANTTWPSASDGTPEQRYDLCQNWRADVVAVLKHDGSGVVEWVKYSAYGVPVNIARCDIDRSGAVNSADMSAWIAIYVPALSTYRLEADYNLDGAVNSADDAAFVADSFSFPATGRGRLSRNDSTTLVDNRIGYAGYQWDPIIKMYYVRNRVFDPYTGRWTRRDPLGYVDGMSLYEYASSAPVGAADTTGLAAGVPHIPMPGDDGSCGSNNGTPGVRGQDACIVPPPPGDSGDDDDPPGPVPPPIPRCRSDSPFCINYTAVCALRCNSPGLFGGRPGGMTYCDRNGNPICCICNQVIDSTYSGGFPASVLIAECIRRHENAHARQGCSRPIRYTPLWGCQEVAAHDIELARLRESRQQCERSPDPVVCKAVIDHRLHQVEQDRAQYARYCQGQVSQH